MCGDGWLTQMIDVKMRTSGSSSFWIEKWYGQVFPSENSEDDNDIEYDLDMCGSSVEDAMREHRRR